MTQYTLTLKHFELSMLTNIPDWQSQAAEQLHAYLLETEQVPSGRGRLTHDWVSRNHSLEVADAIYNAVNAVSPATAVRYSAGIGIDTSLAAWKTQANAVAVAVPTLAPYLTTLRDFELQSVPRWRSLGYESEPTVQQLGLEKRKQALLDDATDKFQTFRESLSAWDGSDPEPLLGGA